jgi:hypothetical protein
MSDIGKTGKSNSFIRLRLRQAESLLCQLRKAILSNFLTFEEQQYLIIFFSFENSSDSRIQNDCHTEWIRRVLLLCNQPWKQGKSPRMRRQDYPTRP